MRKLNVASLIAVVGFFLVSHIPAHATPQPAPPGGPIEKFAEHFEHSALRVRHTLWTRVLDAVVEDGRAGRRDVDYGGLGELGRDVLDSYLTILQDVDVANLPRNEQLAYWLNLYNAGSLKFMMDHLRNTGGRESALRAKNPHQKDRIRVKKIYLGDENFWREPRLTVAGMALSLNDIEHRILYANWDPSKVMYALHCPARGCPALQPKPFTGTNVQAQLVAAAREFTSREDSVKIKGGKLTLSELYEWHLVQLGGEPGVIGHLRAVSAEPLRSQLAGVNTIRKYDFSWRLNGTPPPSGDPGESNLFTRGVSPGNN